MRSLLCVVFALLVFGCREAPTPPLIVDSGTTTGPVAGRVFASLIQLIATPDQFEGREVGVMGYCWAETEGNALYVHEEDHRYLFTKNSVNLNFERSRSAAAGCRDRHVLVLGKFSSRGGDALSGSIDVDIFHIQEPVPTEGGKDPP